MNDQRRIGSKEKIPSRHIKETYPLRRIHFLNVDFNWNVDEENKPEECAQTNGEVT